MSDHLPAHLPECLLDKSIGICICPELEACEARVRNKVFDGHHRYYQQVRVAALDASRDAVAALPRIAVTEIDYNGLAIHPSHVNLEDALAAIDALRGES